jgi:hypothetical protein
MKHLAVILCIAMCFSLIACNRSSNATPYTYEVIEVSEDTLLIAAIKENGEVIPSEQYTVPNAFYPAWILQVGDRISITHSGEVLDTYPMQFAKIYEMSYYHEPTKHNLVVNP